MNAQPTSIVSTDLDTPHAQKLFHLSRSVRAMGSLYVLFAAGAFATAVPSLVKLAVHGVVHKFWVALPVVLAPVVAALALAAYAMLKRPAWGRSVAVVVCSLGAAFMLLMAGQSLFLPHLRAGFLILMLFSALFVMHGAGLVALLQGYALFGDYGISHARLRALVRPPAASPTALLNLSR